MFGYIVELNLARGHIAMGPLGNDRKCAAIRIIATDRKGGTAIETVGTRVL